MELKFTAAELQGYLGEVFPETEGRFEILDLDAGRLRVKMRVGPGDLRPGGTVSGPTMFLLADCAFYMATLALIGREALTVTTNASIDFMRKPSPGDMTADARILKLGRSLSVGDVLIYSHGVAEPVARAGMTYSIPPKRALEKD
ncbi:PaaI family thioesterase [Amaricoccus tamworthensis]|uniref:PaaI family thioesterase n=1 Tax=Amaricoccus tamworthensis TaxID=57002 RepID=UPI003C7EC396